MYLQTYAHDLITENGVLYPDVKRLLSMFQRICATNQDSNVEYVLRNHRNPSSELQIFYCPGDETDSNRIELALRKAGVKLAPNPFAPRKTRKRKGKASK